ncbi:MAG: hypothetical protein IPM92_15510 [Saprospiraceae bacterium]|nr:hypothetical protein [Saprospiraceae bacterium]
MRLDRNIHNAGSFEKIQGIELQNAKLKNYKGRFCMGIILHLLNHNLDPEKVKFERIFSKAYKRP